MYNKKANSQSLLIFNTLGCLEDKIYLSQLSVGSLRTQLSQNQPNTPIVTSNANPTHIIKIRWGQP